MIQYYVGETFMLTSYGLESPAIACVSEDQSDIIQYLSNVRDIPFIDDNTPLENLSKHIQVVAKLNVFSFTVESSANAFLQRDDIQPFLMEEYGPIDRRLTKLNKKKAQRLKLPRVVIEIIEQTAQSFEKELDMAQHTLKELLFYMGGSRKDEIVKNKDIALIMKTCQIISKILQHDGYDLEGDIYFRNPILFCGETEYRNMISARIQQNRMLDEYRYLIEDD